jgi:hypothetical protein
VTLSIDELATPWRMIDGEGARVATLTSGAFTPSTDDLTSLAGEHRSQKIDVTFTHAIPA